MRIFAFVISVLAVSTAKADWIDPVHFTLDNGLELVVIEDNRTDVVRHMVWYRVGAADEELGKSGIAHFFEHLMFKGTDLYPDGAIDQMVTRNGGRHNAFTGQDYTAYYQDVAVDRLPLMMEMEADRMRGLKLRTEEIESEREVVLEERRLRVDNRPGSLMWERLNAAFWVTNTYAIPVIGWAEEIEALQKDDFFEFYETWYAPNNAVVVVAGAISPDEALKLTEKHYGSLKPTPGLKRKERSEALPPPADIRIDFRDPRVRQPSIARLYLAPSYNVGEAADVVALDVVNELLAQGTVSYLYKRLVVEEQLAAGVSSFYSDDGVSHGSLSMSLTPNPGIAPDDLIAAYHAAVDDFLASEITPEAVDRARGRLKAELVYAQDSVAQLAQIVGATLAVGMSLDDLVQYPSRLDSVTVEQAKSVAASVLKGKHTATAVLLPEGAI